MSETHKFSVAAVDEYLAHLAHLESTDPTLLLAFLYHLNLAFLVFRNIFNPGFSFNLCTAPPAETVPHGALRAVRRAGHPQARDDEPAAAVRRRRRGGVRVGAGRREARGPQGWLQGGVRSPGALARTAGRPMQRRGDGLGSTGFRAQYRPAHRGLAQGQKGAVSHDSDVAQGQRGPAHRSAHYELAPAASTGGGRACTQASPAVGFVWDPEGRSVQERGEG